VIRVVAVEIAQHPLLDRGRFTGRDVAGRRQPQRGGNRLRVRAGVDLRDVHRQDVRGKRAACRLDPKQSGRRDNREPEQHNTHTEAPLSTTRRSK
jgi:hypothetical protein